MKVKAKRSFQRMNVRSVPCTAREYNDLKSGKTIAVPKVVGEEMINMNIVSKKEK